VSIADHARIIRETALHVLDGDLTGTTGRHADDCPGCHTVAALDALLAEVKRLRDARVRRIGGRATPMRATSERFEDERGVDVSVLPMLSMATGCTVMQVPDGQGTGGGGYHVFLEARYAKLIERTSGKGSPLRPLRLPGGGRRTAQAKAIYYLLHEVCHATVQIGKQYEYPKSEIEANQYASDNFRRFCMTIGYSADATKTLWRALPDYYRRPELV